MDMKMVVGRVIMEKGTDLCALQPEFVTERLVHFGADIVEQWKMLRGQIAD